MAKITPQQLKAIQTIKSKHNIDDYDFRASLRSYFPTKWKKGQRPSTTHLTVSEAGIVLDHLKRISGQAAPHPGRPSKVDRNKQLQKIEALLVAGKKEWSYAHSIARNICGVDKIEWVPDYDLYKIITALIKQGQRHNWPIHES